LSDACARSEVSTPHRADSALSNATSKYRHAPLWKSVWQVADSIVPFCALWYLMYLSTAWSYWLTLLLAIPTAGFLVRIFAIQHDCGHRSFFRSQRANDWLGYGLSVLTLTPYQLWRRTHARHHASSGDLHHRGQGDVTVLTVDEYLSRSSFGRLRYQLYRNPFIMFVLGASYLFIVRHRFTLGIPRNWRRERAGVHATNAALVAMIVLASFTIGLPTFFMIHLPVVILGATIGSWLFFVQHQFEHAYWQPHEDWDFARAALDGSSYYQLPKVLQWFTGNIGFHHIHHLDSRIPNYNLAACHAAEPAFQNVVTLGVRDSMNCMRLKLWDERQQRMVAFSDARIYADAS
jgi:omega-6 fatty acid desaturase (delta-12 desaturase)